LLLILALPYGRHNSADAGVCSQNNEMLSKRKIDTYFRFGVVVVVAQAVHRATPALWMPNLNVSVTLHSGLTLLELVHHSSVGLW
jgi:hypothetical protein